MKIESSTKLIQIRIYDEHADNYILSLFVFKDGERGVITGLLGDGFYNNVKAIFELLKDSHGINVIHGSVTEIHAKLIKRYSKGFSVTYEPTICEGRDMVWITARLLPYEDTTTPHVGAI